MVATKYLQSLWNENGLRFLIMCYLAYIAFGGFCFFLIEGRQQPINYEMFKGAKQTFRSENPCATEESFKVLFRALQSIIEPAARKSNDSSNFVWTYSQSVLFAVSVVTTVGYGHVTPESETGKITCMIYALIGIPLHNILLKSLIKHLMKLSRALRKLISRIPLNIVSSPVKLEIIHQVAITIPVLLVFFVLPAFVFCHLEEDWNYLDSLYFCTITLMTVGLGDYVPSENPDQPYEFLYRMGVTVYIIIGITAMHFLSAHVADFIDAMRDDKQDSENTPIIQKYVSVSYGSIV